MHNKVNMPSLAALLSELTSTIFTRPVLKGAFKKNRQIQIASPNKTHMHFHHFCVYLLRSLFIFVETPLAICLYGSNTYT